MAGWRGVDSLTLLVVWVRHHNASCQVSQSYGQTTLWGSRWITVHLPIRSVKAHFRWNVVVVEVRINYGTSLVSHPGIIGQVRLGVIDVYWWTVILFTELDISEVWTAVPGNFPTVHFGKTVNECLREPQQPRYNHAITVSFPQIRAIPACFIRGGPRDFLSILNVSPCSARVLM